MRFPERCFQGKGSRMIAAKKDGALYGGMSLQEALERASAAIQSGQFDTARQALEKVLDREPNNAAAMFWLGFCEQDQESREAYFDKVKDRSVRPARRSNLKRKSMS